MPTTTADPTTSPRQAPSWTSWIVPVTICLVGVGLLAYCATSGGAVAPTPAIFASEVTLAQALSDAGSRGAPVVALATADWCPPCQSLKRGALADDRVARRLSELGAVAVSVDLTNSSDPRAAEEGARLGIEVLPTLVYLDANGREVSRRVGAGSAESLLAWLDASSTESLVLGR